MAPINEVIEILDKINTLHEKKNQDYSSGNRPFENFERSGIIGSWFGNNTDKSFAVLIGTKLARLAVLLDSGRSPNNESIEDSFLDLATYCILWGAHYSGERKMINEFIAKEVIYKSEPQHPLKPKE